MKIKDMVTVIDQAIAEFHDLYPKHLRGKIRIAWGFASKQAEREERSMPPLTAVRSAVEFRGPGL